MKQRIKKSSHISWRKAYLYSGSLFDDSGSSVENGSENGSLGARRDGLLSIRFSNDRCERSPESATPLDVVMDNSELTRFLFLLEQSLDSTLRRRLSNCTFRVKNEETNRSTTEGPLTFLALSSSTVASVTGAASTSGSATAAFSLATSLVNICCNVEE